MHIAPPPPAALSDERLMFGTYFLVPSFRRDLTDVATEATYPTAHSHTKAEPILTTPAISSIRQGYM